MLEYGSDGFETPSDRRNQKERPRPGLIWSQFPILVFFMKLEFKVVQLSFSTGSAFRCNAYSVSLKVLYISRPALPKPNPI